MDALSITPAYLRNDASDSGEVVDFRHWGIPLSRRFRALKVWFVIRTHGVRYLQSYVRNHIRLGEVFASLIASRPDLFKIVVKPAYALTVISIVPRIPSILRKLLAVKAKEANMGKVKRDCGLQKNSDETEKNNGDFSVEHRNSGKVMSANGEPNANGNGLSNGKLTTNGAISGNGMPNPKKSFIVGDLKPEGVYTNGNAASNGLSKDKTNGYATVDEVSHLKHDPATSLLSPLTSTDFSHRNGLWTSDDTIDAWLAEYANLATKEVYDLINWRGEILLTSTSVGGLFVIRINGANPKTEEKYMRRAFEILVSTAEEVLG